MSIAKDLKGNSTVTFSEVCLQGKLKTHYGDDIIFTSRPGLPNTVCFKDFAHKVLRKQWPDANCQTNEKERIMS